MITVSDFCEYKEMSYGRKKEIINNSVLVDYLGEVGYRCFGDYPDLSLVIVKDGIIRKTDSHELFHFLRNELLKSHKAWISALISNKYIMSRELLVHLNKVKSADIKDTAGSSYVSFRNGIVKITHDSVSLIDISDLIDSGIALSPNSIIDRDISIVKDYKDGVWYDFCKKVAGDDGIDYMMRILGHILHRYKDKANPKIAIFGDADNAVNAGANGGTGKSLIAYDSIDIVRPTFWIDGKMFNPKDKFAFQGTLPIHNVVCIDDLNEDTDMKALYNKGTGNFSAEDKFKAKSTFKYGFSPKISITTNYGVKISGSSDSRRFLIFGIKRYYSESVTPLSEYGHRFFDDWVGDLSIEYDRFFSFMFACIQMYLKHGAENFRHELIVEMGASSSVGYEISEVFDEKIDMLVGEDKAMKMSDICKAFGIDISSRKSVSEMKDYAYSQGYKIEFKRVRLDGSKNPSKLYYFSK